MSTYDILMLTVLIGATLLGALKGFVWQLASLASIGVSYVAAVRFRGPVADLIGGKPPWNAFLAMLLVYVGVSAVIWMICRALSKSIDNLKLTGFDRQMGAIFGAVKGVILCAIVTLFAVTLLEGSQRQSIIDSRSGYYIAQLLSRAHAVMPPEVHEVLEPYIHRLDDRLPDVGQATRGGQMDRDPNAETRGQRRPEPSYEPRPASIPAT